jgi:ABC-2 type transport system ATP-binding protein
MAAKATINAKGLTKDYQGKVVVDHIDLDLRSGEVFGLLGPNGAGKTTTILMLLGLTEPSGGKVQVLGMDPARNPLEVKSQVGYLPDAVGFYESMTGAENLRFTARLNGLTGQDMEDRIDTALGEVGLADAKDQPTGTYSRGMRQRLGIADALIKQPKVLILDEPTTAIDPEGVQEILILIRKLAEERGVTILLSSHLLHQVQTVCDRVAIFVQGKVVALGAPHELAARAGGPEELELRTDGDVKRTESALASMPDVKTVVQTRIPGLLHLQVARGGTGRVVKGLIDKGIVVTHVRQTSEDLDEVYRRYFQEDKPPVPVSAGAGRSESEGSDSDS